MPQKDIEFLTEEKIDTGYLISILKKDVDKHEGENARILQGLLFEFKNNFSTHYNSNVIVGKLIWSSQI